MNDIKNKFHDYLEESKKLKGGISIACGYASHMENKDLGIEELELRADKNMYKEKAEHYKNCKLERRNS